MSTKKTKRRISLAKGEFVSAALTFVFLFVVAGCIMLFFGIQKIERYRNLESLENLTMDKLHENIYVKGSMKSTLCCYGTYEVYDCYVVPIGTAADGEQQYITIFADTYNSVKLGKLPTCDYVLEEMGAAQKNSEQEELEVFGVIKKLPEDCFDYDFLAQQLGTDNKMEIDSIVSDAYYIQYAKEDSIKYWSQAGLTLLACGIILYIFFVVPAYRKKKVVVNEEEAYRDPDIRKETRKKVTNSIQHFLDRMFDDITMVFVEHCGKIVKISKDTEIAAILNCFTHATYDKVYEDYVNQDELYTIEFVMKNGETIESSVSPDNIIYWYGSFNRMDYVSCGKLKKILNDSQ